MASVYVWNGEDGRGVFVAKTLRAAVRNWVRYYSLDTFMIHREEDGHEMSIRQAAEEIGGPLEETIADLLFPDSNFSGYWPVKGELTREEIILDNGKLVE